MCQKGYTLADIVEHEYAPYNVKFVNAGIRLRHNTIIICTSLNTICPIIFFLRNSPFSYHLFSIPRDRSLLYSGHLLWPHDVSPVQ